jgi:hypothetical protein
MISLVLFINLQKILVLHFEQLVAACNFFLRFIRIADVLTHAGLQLLIFDFEMGVPAKLAFLVLLLKVLDKIEVICFSLAELANGCSF